MIKYKSAIIIISGFAIISFAIAMVIYFLTMKAIVENDAGGVVASVLLFLPFFIILTVVSALSASASLVLSLKSYKVSENKRLPLIGIIVNAAILLLIIVAVIVLLAIANVGK